MRSATAPETIVVAVPQKAAWKKKNAITQLLGFSMIALGSQPIQPPNDGPNIIPKPSSPKSAQEMQKSMRFLNATLIEFLARTSPDSTQVNPACIATTRQAESNTQRMSVGVWTGGITTTSSPVREEGRFCCEVGCRSLFWRAGNPAS